MSNGAIEDRSMKTPHGWVVLEFQGEGYNDKIWVEYTNAGGKRTRKDMGFGNSGCVRAIEFFDKRVGQPVSLEPLLKGCYRVVTETK